MNRETLPEWLQFVKGICERSPVWFIDCRETDFSPESPRWQERINTAIGGVLEGLHCGHWEEPVLIKTHIGEPRCSTRMLPQYCRSTVRHFQSRGMFRMASGDSTVAYSGPRGYRDNPSDSAPYLHLAGAHGWTETGPLGIPFVVLDRPRTSVQGRISFDSEEVTLTPAASKRFREVYLAGGFSAAGTIVNHVHLTLHDMAQVACAVKGITMGGSSRRGKLVMHQCYFPVIDEGQCLRCGRCSLGCPEKALHGEKGALPVLERDRCIGCGECAGICPSGGIAMVTREIEDWQRGSESLPYRMADYLLGMMEGRWGRLVNIVHLYNITRHCDCVDEAQAPLTPHIGFLVGRNPFAVDLAATRLLHEEVDRLVRGGKIRPKRSPVKDTILDIFIPGYHGIAPYHRIRKKYGIVVEPDIIGTGP